jgi:hypothetical protein
MNETHSLNLKRLNSLNMSTDIVRHGLEILQRLLSLIDDGLILEDGTVVGKVDGGGLGSKLGMETLGVGVSFPESLKGGDGLCAQQRERLRRGG